MEIQNCYDDYNDEVGTDNVYDDERCLADDDDDDEGGLCDERTNDTVQQKYNSSNCLFEFCDSLHTDLYCPQINVSLKRSKQYQLSWSS